MSKVSTLKGKRPTFQRTKTWKESPDPERDAKLDRIEQVLERFPDRVFAFDEVRAPRNPPHRRFLLGGTG